MQAETPEISYFQKRCDAIGLTTEKNKLCIKEHKALENSNIIEFPILCEDAKTGNIVIPIYDVNGEPANFYKDNSGKLYNGKQKPIEIVRYHPDVYQELCNKAEKEGKPAPGKYRNPTGAKTLPWISPNIIEAVATKTKINTIVITEGYIKAISGWLNGLYIFGLSGIQNSKDKDTGTLHPDIIRTINECEVENIILLYDGDCTNISLKALTDGKDLYKRPAGFFYSARNINELLKDYRKERHFDVYFAHVNTEKLEGDPKGLDDLFEAFPTHSTDIVSELTSYSKLKPHYFVRHNITINLTKVLNHLHINSAETFYTAHNQIIKEHAFIFNGTKYQFDFEKNELKIMVPGAAKSYFRVGDDYYEKIFVPNEYGVLEYRYVKRSKTTIIDDHGKKIIEHIPKYKDFCIKPDHENFQEVIDNCFNSYKPFAHTASNEIECAETLRFIKHIFGEQFEMGLDYIQILYKKPTEKLPILSLVSKENKTGKSTFGEFLKAIFGGNMATIGNDQLENNFNAGWADKLIICCEESFIEKKKTVEKIKALSTGKKIEMEKKGIDTSEISFFGKFILNSNNETNFTIVNEQDTRYWVIKVPVIEKEIPNLIETLIDEIPNFLCFLNQRHLSVPHKESRMWFDPARLQTDALKRLVEGNKSGPQKELTNILRTLFSDTGFWQLEFTIKYIGEVLFRNRYERNYIERLLHEKFNLKAAISARRFSYPEIKIIHKEGSTDESIIMCKAHGKPVKLTADQFLTPEELDVFKLSEEAVFNGQLELAPIEVRERGQQLTMTSISEESKLVNQFSNADNNDDLPF